MEFFKANTTINFMGQRKLAAIFSIIIFVGSLISLSIFGLHLGLDFTGGNSVEVTFPQKVDLNKLRNALRAEGFKQATVQAYNVRDVAIRMAPQQGVSPQQLKERLAKVIPNAKIGSFEFIGPQVGKTLFTNGLLAILVSLIGTMIYIALRFDYRFAISAAVALIHDPILILGVFSLFHLEFNMIVLTAVLTVIGYSLNDTIVVYDRVRECFRKVRKGTPTDIMNLSINQTLSRTIMTSGLTLVVVIALFIFGGELLRGFALALIIGIVIGTYSSIYVAGSLAVAIGLTRQSLLPSAKQIDDTP